MIYIYIYIYNASYDKLSLPFKKLMTVFPFTINMFKGNAINYLIMQYTIF